MSIAVSGLLALYALTAMLREQESTVAVVFVTAIAAVVWAAWDPSLVCFGVALGCALIGPAAEIAFVDAGLYRYASGSDGLFGVAAWLPSQFFAQGVVASGLLRALARQSAPAR